MSGERWMRAVRQFAIPAVAGLAVAAAPIWGARAGLGIAVGGGWNLLSLWCLAQLLSTWLGPQRSTRRVVWWLLMKFPLLYAAAYGLLRIPFVSLVGFSVGFTAVLVTAVVVLMFHAQRSIMPVSK